MVVAPYQGMAASQTHPQLIMSYLDMEIFSMGMTAPEAVRVHDKTASTVGDLRTSPVRSLAPELDASARNAQIIKHPFDEISVVAQGLDSPDSIAIHPTTKKIYVSEEDPGRISLIQKSQAVAVVDHDTPIYSRDAHNMLRKDAPLKNPEGIAFGNGGELFVVEDVPGGRLIQFTIGSDTRSSRGEVVSVPGDWKEYAWEDVDIGPNGEILMAGSSLEAMTHKDTLSTFAGSLLYRDQQGKWWKILHHQFASYSSVRFSKTGKQAVYACEFSGEVGWLSLETKQVLNGYIDEGIKSVEGVSVLPNGLILAATENGRIVCVDPRNKTTQVVCEHMGTLESAVFDSTRNRILVTEDGDGKLISFTCDESFSDENYALDHVAYQPQQNAQFVPAQCPDYLKHVLTMGGVDETAVSFAQIVNKLPMIAADMDVTPMDKSAVYQDAVEHIQFVVFNPNKITYDKNGLPSPAFGVFVAKHRSGEMTQTSLVKLQSAVANMAAGTITAGKTVTMTVPQPGPVSVSSLGATTVQFLGMGETPDYSIVVNPRHPAESYMVVYLSDGSIEQYALSLPKATSADSIVVGYNSENTEEWLSLGGVQNEVASNR